MQKGSIIRIPFRMDRLDHTHVLAAKLHRFPGDTIKRGIGMDAGSSPGINFVLVLVKLGLFFVVDRPVCKGETSSL